MDTRNGDLYASFDDAREAGVPEENILEVKGNKQEIERLSKLIRQKAERKGK